MAHRRKVTAVDPSLSNRVGKILKKPRTVQPQLERNVARSVGVPELGPTLVGPKGREKVLRVIPVRRDAPDLRKIARTIEMELRKPVGERIIDRLAKDGQDKAA